MNDSFSLVTQVLKHVFSVQNIRKSMYATLSCHLKFFIINLSSLNSLGCHF